MDTQLDGPGFERFCKGMRCIDEQTSGDATALACALAAPHLACAALRAAPGRGCKARATCGAAASISSGRSAPKPSTSAGGIATRPR